MLCELLPDVLHTHQPLSRRTHVCGSCWEAIETVSTEFQRHIPQVDGADDEEVTHPHSCYSTFHDQISRPSYSEPQCCFEWMPEPLTHGDEPGR